MDKSIIEILESIDLSLGRIADALSLGGVSVKLDNWEEQLLTRYTDN